MSKSLGRLKERLRDGLPPAWQLPLKYQYCRLRSALEPELAMLPFLVRTGDLAIDAGANRGIYTYCLWKLGCAVQAFEPNPDCSAPLKAWAEGKTEVAVNACALSDQTGQARLFVPVDGAGVEHDASASLKPTGANIAHREQVVAMRTLDSFGFADVELIKIDVEGHETAVLQGAESTICGSRPAMLIEIEQRHGNEKLSDVFAMIARWGYKGFFLKDGILKPIERFDAEIDQNIARFGGRKSDYINNFLFLANAKIDPGRYGDLFERFALGT